MLGDFVVFRNFRMSHLLKNSKGVTAIGRHSIKGKTPNGLAIEGEGKAAWAGKRLPEGFRLFASHGDQTRHATTAKLMMENYKGFKAENMKLSDELGFKCIKNMPFLEERIKATSDAQVLADWIDGRISTEVIAPAAQTGAAALKYSLGETEKLMKATPERPFHLALTSSWFDAAMLQALGIDYRSIKPKKLRAKAKPAQGDSFKETEAILFFHVPGQGIAMRFRGRPFDVTKQLKAILG